jgi:putative PIG3 family NAD(P)H quinone oxidoreductase
MKYVTCSQSGGPEVLAIAEMPVPLPRPDEVLIRVTAAGLNRADILQRQGKYPPPAGASPVLGLEVSGRIAELGAAVTGWKTGDAVCALLAGGGYAEYCVADAGLCLPVPEHVSLEDAAALPEAVFTVWTNLFEPLRLPPGGTFLMQGGSSGVGSMAIQVARSMGARVIATAGGPEKCAFCRQLGCEQAFDYQREDWEQAALAWSAGKGVDVILDMVGGEYFPKHLRLLARRGWLVQIASIQGRKVTADLGLIMSKQLRITGSTLRSRPVAEKTVLRDSLQQLLWPKIAAEEVRPIVDRIFPLNHVADAHRRMESSQHIGKILLRLA